MFSKRCCTASHTTAAKKPLQRIHTRRYNVSALEEGEPHEPRQSRSHHQSDDFNKPSRVVGAYTTRSTWLDTHGTTPMCRTRKPQEPRRPRNHQTGTTPSPVARKSSAIGISLSMLQSSRRATLGMQSKPNIRSDAEAARALAQRDKHYLR